MLQSTSWGVHATRVSTPPTSPLLSLPSASASSLSPLMVCASISASLMGLAPLETELRRRFRMWMKSEAEITPAMLASLASHRGAEAVPCSRTQLVVVGQMGFKV